MIYFKLVQSSLVLSNTLVVGQNVVLKFSSVHARIILNFYKAYFTETPAISELLSLSCFRMNWTKEFLELDTVARVSSSTFLWLFFHTHNLLY